MKRAYISDECEHGYPHPHMKVDGEGCGGGEGSKLLEGPVFVMGKGDSWLVIAALQDESLIQVVPGSA